MSERRLVDIAADYTAARDAAGVLESLGQDPESRMRDLADEFDRAVLGLVGQG